MKRSCLLGIFVLLAVVRMDAQHVIYANLKELVENRGDTLSTLKIEKRSKNQILLMGGADYRVSVDKNPGLCRYLKSRCYAVQADSALYVNCKKVRYKRFRFGGWYAPAMWVRGKVYFCAQPVGSVAASTTQRADAMRLGGDVGTAIAASGLVNARVYYELNPETGKVEFVGKDKMQQLLQNDPGLLEAFLEEESEKAEVTGKYLLMLK